MVIRVSVFPYEELRRSAYFGALAVVTHIKDV